MKQGHFAQHWFDEDGNPAGGVSSGRGFAISWQNGPLGRGDGRREPNGAFVEDIIAAAIVRIDFYQESKFACIENAKALAALRSALTQLETRTHQREARRVEGTHEK